MKRLMCVGLMCVLLSGCSDGFMPIKVKNHVNTSRPNEECVNAPFNSKLSDYGFLCKDKNGKVTYLFYGGSELKVTQEVVLFK